MSNTVQAQPSVVLRSTYVHVRALLAIAAIVIVGLTTTVAVLAINNGSTSAGPTGQTNPSGITNYPGHF